MSSDPMTLLTAAWACDRLQALIEAHPDDQALRAAMDVEPGLKEAFGVESFLGVGADAIKSGLTKISSSLLAKLRDVWNLLDVKFKQNIRERLYLRVKNNFFKHTHANVLMAQTTGVNTAPNPQGYDIIKVRNYITFVTELAQFYLQADTLMDNGTAKTIEQTVRELAAKAEIKADLLHLNSKTMILKMDDSMFLGGSIKPWCETDTWEQLFAVWNHIEFEGIRKILDHQYTLLEEAKSAKPETREAAKTMEDALMIYDAIFVFLGDIVENDRILKLLTKAATTWITLAKLDKPEGEDEDSVEELPAE